MALAGHPEPQAEACCGVHADDKLIMKWNAEWDHGSDEGWTDAEGYDAWLTNMWNGSERGGSGEMSHSKIEWSESCKVDGTASPDAYCIWGQFEVVHEHVRDADGNHVFLAHAKPAGFGK